MLRMYVSLEQRFRATEWQASTAATLGLSSTLRRGGPSEDCRKTGLSPFLLL